MDKGNDVFYCVEGAVRKTVRMHRPGFEPGSTAWKAAILPLDYQCLLYGNDERYIKTVLVRGVVYVKVFGNSTPRCML